MRKIIIFIFGILLIAGVIYLASGWGRDWRRRVISACDKDIIYLNDDTATVGWIWNETGNTIGGQTIKEELFTLDRTEYKRIEKDFLFKTLKQLL